MDAREALVGMEGPNLIAGVVSMSSLLMIMV
jgi:hypothetical protein